LDIAACRAAGKALFLDTMGFLNPESLGGQPGAASLEKLAGSYGRRVLPRHHVIARFARDGLCGTTLTTNFDLLLEGAFRLAGFRDEQVESIDVFPPTDVSRYARVTSPREFFREGKAHRTAVLVKMHGCADTYRRVAKAAGGEGGDARRLESYLRSMVFTYREIQNWREDAWAADFLRTLLRTRTVVFTGYSLQDPVVHDTFRTVYEEMARVSRSDAGDDATDAENGTESKPPTARRRPAPTAGDAPAFFFDVLDAAMPDKSPFHALEVLKAASDAVGVPRGDFGQHPNLLRFHGRGTGKFPNLDELYRWLFHLVVRRRQRECLLNDLRRTFTALHGENRPAAEFDGVKALMNAVFDAERAEARAWATPAADAATHAERRRRMGRIVSWTESFHPGLLREFGIVDQIRREGGFQLRPAEIRRRGWYYPVMQNADWTCWGAVVELAIRRMVDHVNGDEARLPAIDRLWSAEGDHPTILFFSGNREPRPTTTSFEDAPFPPLRAVSVLFSSSDAPAQSLSLHGQPSTVCLWQLTGNDAPWRGTSWRVYPAPESGRRIRVIDEPGDEPAERLSSALQACRPPPAITLWRWASRTETEDDRRRAADWLGLPRPTL
ncbi:MAG: SIR2 family protein, partial [Verrucomicrobiales bacterium]|nr:SIR2 family protein [Verrucomicrobiales bacterium]